MHHRIPLLGADNQPIGYVVLDEARCQEVVAIIKRFSAPLELYPTIQDDKLLSFTAQWQPMRQEKA